MSRGGQTDPALDRARERILDAALVHVPFDGWTETALAAGAADAGYDRTMVARAFPGGALEAVIYHSARADQAMLAAMAELPLDDMGTSAKVAAAVRLRLEGNAGHREAIRRALAFLAMPHNAGAGARCLYHTVDAIWHAVGDGATDYSYYTKRGLLAAVYGSTVLYWLDDDSEGSAQTWAFLERRIADLLAVPRMFDRARRLVDRLPSPFRLFGKRFTGGDAARRRLSG